MIHNISLVLKSYAGNYVGLPIGCWHGIFLTFINSVTTGICFFLSIYFVDTLHLNIATAGLMISFYGLGTVPGGMISGKLADKISPKIISIVSLFAKSAAFLLLAKFNSISLLMFNLFGLGVASYGFKTSNNVWMLKQCDDQINQARLKTINISHAASNLGLGLSGIIIGIFASYGFKNIFYLSSVILFLSGCYLVFQNVEKINLVKKDLADEKMISDKKHLEIKNINKKIIILMLICVFLVGLIIAQLSATYPIYVQKAFPLLGVKAVSILFILDTSLIILFQAPLVNSLNNYNKIFIVGIGAFLMGLGMLVLSFSFNFYLAIVSCLIWTTGEMLFISMSQLVCYEKGATKKKGQSMGAFQATFAASAVAGPVLGGFAYRFADGNVLWYLSAGLGSLCFLACNFYKKYD
jgi:MFS family permease